MKNLPLLFVRRYAPVLFFLTVVFSTSVFSQTSTFTYQGRLNINSEPANGTFNMVFDLFAVPAGGTPLGTNSKTSVPVVNGIFTVQLDFGATAFTGATRYLQISVNGTPLMPRQEITSPPYSIRSIYSSAADALSNLCTGCVNDSMVDDFLTIMGGNIDATPVGGIMPAPGTFTTLTATNSVAFPGNSITDAMVSDTLTIAGGIINNTVIGATTPAAGTFTDLKSNNNTFTLDADNTGAGANVSIVAEQGSEPNGEIRYNATTNQWELSNNGGAFTPIGGAVNTFQTTNAGGTNLVPDSQTDTLTLTSSGTNITITGDAATDTATIGISESVLAGDGLAANGDALAVNTGSGIQVSSDAVSLGNLTSNWNQASAFDILLGNASSELSILESAGGTFFGTLDVGDLTANQTYTFSGASGTVWTSGNDGASSALDADLLDGLNSSQFVRSDQAATINGAVANFTTSTTGVTPSVAGLTVLNLNYSGSTIITNLSGGAQGQCVVLVTENGNADINDAGNFKLSSNWTPDTDDTLTVCFVGNSWVETARSAN
ncbi:MAG: hypothetical protein M3209_15530 [Acidobacteriota bacterium]|nr:hypothetical protein [Acidobacteriota bacterium]